MPIQSKIEPARVPASEWLNPGPALRGLLEGKNLQTNITLLRYATDVVGEGPTLHVHPYDEIFVIRKPDHEQRRNASRRGPEWYRRVSGGRIPNRGRSPLREIGAAARGLQTCRIRHERGLSASPSPVCESANVH